MKKRQIFWAIAFGAMLAVSGCGDDGDSNNGTGGAGATAGTGGTAGSAGSGGTAGSGGGSGSFCETVCTACTGVGQAECTNQCEMGIGSIPGELDGCPTELQAVADCLGANGCENSEACTNQWTAYFTCLITSGL